MPSHRRCRPTHAAESIVAPRSAMLPSGPGPSGVAHRSLGSVIIDAGREATDERAEDVDSRAGIVPRNGPRVTLRATPVGRARAVELLVAWGRGALPWWMSSVPLQARRSESPGRTSSPCESFRLVAGQD